MTATDVVGVRRVRHQAATAALALLVCAARVLAQEDAQRYLDLGKQALRAKRYTEAVQDLRIARFMTLEDPALQTQALALLVLAEDSVGFKADREVTLDRFMEVEGRFGAFQLDSLDPDLQARFKSIVMGRYAKDRIMRSQNLAAELGLMPRDQVSPRRTATPVLPTPTSGPPPPTAVPTQGTVVAETIPMTPTQAQPSPLATRAGTAVVTPSFTYVQTATHTPVGAAPATRIPTASATPVPVVPTATATARPTETWTSSPLPTSTRTATATSTAAPPTFTLTRTSTPAPPTLTFTWTPTPVPPTFTRTPTPVPPTLTPSLTASATATRTASPTATTTHSRTPTSTPTWTASLTPTRTASQTYTASSTATATRTFTPSHTRTFTPTSTVTHTPSFTASHTRTFTAPSTATSTATSTPSYTRTFTASPTFTATSTLTPSFTRTPTPTRTSTPSIFVAPGKVDTPPKPIEMVMPRYPEAALKARVRGVVILRVLVSHTGIPLDIRVERGVRPDINDASIEAARHWRFQPATKDGQPVRTFTTIRFPFEGVQFARTPLPGFGTIPTPSR